ncbi:glycosyltransferase family 4 protein [uncultured Sphingomonas sp.]|uniref:glycosyltransferase family 4 protein n=1 Tax=uncultured Sphingomonas sp. TaxID=158754 RepID=UPI0035CA6DA2
MTVRLLMTADAVGGVWRYATDLARALRPHGVETTLAVLGPAPTDDQLQLLRYPGLDPGSRFLSADEAGLRVEPGVTGGEAGDIRMIHTSLPLDWLCDGSTPVVQAGQAIADLARDLRADFVHLNSPTLAAAARFPAPVVAVAHGCTATWWSAAHGTAPDPAYRWHGDLMRAGLLAADATVAPSAAFAADLQRTYALPTAPLAIHNGRPSPSPHRGEGRGEGPSREPAPHALTAGRLWDRVKNTAVLDRAAARLSAPIRAAGPVTSPHGETVRPDYLHLLGTLSNEALAAELAQRPIFVSVTSFEPFGLAVLEAAAAGCALVLSDIPTFRELWDGAAIFVASHDDAAIAAAIEELLADPARRETLAQAARTRAARYTPGATATAMAALYARLAPACRAAA